MFNLFEFLFNKNFILSMIILILIIIIISFNNIMLFVLVIKKDNFKKVFFLVFLFLVLYLISDYFLLFKDSSFELYESMLSLKKSSKFLRVKDTFGSVYFSKNYSVSNYINTTSGLNLGYNNGNIENTNYWVVKGLNQNITEQVEGARIFYKLYEQADKCKICLESFNITKFNKDKGYNASLHPMCLNLFCNENNILMLDIRIFSSFEFLKCNLFLKNIKFMERLNFNLDFKDQYITNYVIRFHINDRLSVYDNIYNLTGLKVQNLDLLKFTKKFKIYNSDYQNFSDYFLKRIYPILNLDPNILHVTGIGDNLEIYLKDSNHIQLKFKCCGKTRYL